VGVALFWLWGSAFNHKLLDCRWYALLLTRTVNTPLALCEAWGEALAVTGRLLIAMAGRLQSKSADGVVVRKTAGSACSRGRACECNLMNSARELIWLVPTWAFADLLLSLVTLRTAERTAWTPELVLLTEASFRIALLMSRGGPNVDTVRNNSCIVAILGYHENSVSLAVAWIPSCVTCQRFPWKVPTNSSNCELYKLRTFVTISDL
jgi:hypothetical protein